MAIERGILSAKNLTGAIQKKWAKRLQFMLVEATDEGLIDPPIEPSEQGLLETFAATPEQHVETQRFTDEEKSSGR